jgi:hypothetical protein
MTYVFLCFSLGSCQHQVQRLIDLQYRRRLLSVNCALTRDFLFF